MEKTIYDQLEEVTKQLRELQGSYAALSTEYIKLKFKLQRREQKIKQQVKSIRRLKQDINLEVIQAWEEWLKTEEGQRCTKGKVQGEYLQNRLNLAFSTAINRGVDLGIVIGIEYQKSRSEAS